MRETARQLANDTRDIARERRTKQHDSVQTTRGHTRHNTLTTYKAMRATSANDAQTSTQPRTEQHADSATTCATPDNRYQIMFFIIHKY
jgi:hypothetical protein